MSYETRENAEFPPAGIDGFLSHFVFSLRINRGDLAGAVFNYTWPAALQSVVRSEPFIYRRGENHTAEFPLPPGSKLPRQVSEQDFLTVPPDFFEDGKETIFLQILNLDARGSIEGKPTRCILGETFLAEYPDIFQPSFGATQSLNGKGLPARIFFVPNGIFETPFGALHTRPKALLGAEIDAIPPVGSKPSLLGSVELDSVETLRAQGVRTLAAGEGDATLLALDHPIDAQLNVPEDQLFQTVQRAIAR